MQTWNKGDKVEGASPCKLIKKIPFWVIKNPEPLWGYFTSIDT